MNKKENKFNSGIAINSTLSYEKYLNMGLMILHKKLSTRVYKLAPKKNYPIFERGKDLRVRIYWEKESKYEFIIERSFWFPSNTNKEDRKYMRVWADHKLSIVKNAMVKISAE
jgi:hypothetical protein|tara:strand:+ start:1141 stop:1479 length:339 start_codon:yes stop_codon:yes gene_type:complete